MGLFSFISVSSSKSVHFFLCLSFIIAHSSSHPYMSLFFSFFLLTPCTRPSPHPRTFFSFLSLSLAAFVYPLHVHFSFRHVSSHFTSAFFLGLISFSFLPFISVITYHSSFFISFHYPQSVPCMPVTRTRGGLMVIHGLSPISSSFCTS